MPNKSFMNVSILKEAGFEESMLALLLAFSVELSCDSASASKETSELSLSLEISEVSIDCPSSMTSIFALESSEPISSALTEDTNKNKLIPNNANAKNPLFIQNPIIHKNISIK